MKKILFILLPLLGVLFALYFMFARPFMIKKAEVSRELKTALDEVKRFYSSPEGPPSQDIIQELEKGNQILEKEYVKVRKALYREYKIEIPPDQNPVLYFMEKYYQKKKEWQEYAALKKVKIPNKFGGLPETLPSESEVPNLLKKLDNMDWFLKKLVDAGVKEIKSLEVYSPEDKGIYVRIPLTTTLTCDLLSFTKLLYQLENSRERFLVVEDIGLEAKEKVREIPLEPVMDTARRRPRPVVEPGFSLPSPEERRRVKKISEKVLEVTLSLSILEWSKI